MSQYSNLLSPDRWRYEGQCTCGGTLTIKYNYINQPAIKLRIKPGKNKCNLYSRHWCEWDKPLDTLQELLADHGLASPLDL